MEWAVECQCGMSRYVYETSTQGGPAAAVAGARHVADRGGSPAGQGADRARQGRGDRIAARRVEGHDRGGAHGERLRRRARGRRPGPRPARVGRRARRLSRAHAPGAARLPAVTACPRAGLCRARLRPRRRGRGRARAPPRGVRSRVRHESRGRVRRHAARRVGDRLGELPGDGDSGPGGHRAGRPRRRRRRGEPGRRSRQGYPPRGA
jgi:hypothetical protein